MEQRDLLACKWWTAGGFAEWSAGIDSDVSIMVAHLSGFQQTKIELPLYTVLYTPVVHMVQNLNKVYRSNILQQGYSSDIV